MKTFLKGGIHPEENKLSVNAKIAVCPLPEVCIVPLAQSMGAPAVALVNKGDVVKTGQLIAKGDAFISSNIHAPVSGQVLKIDDAADSSGYKRKCIFITTQGDEWLDSIDRSEKIEREITAEASVIKDKIKEAGIVGLGGATFPTHIKLTIPTGKKADYLIINGVECEPYLTSDHRLMLEKAEEILVGIQILKKAIGATTALIGIENNKQDAIAHLTKLAAAYSGIEVHALRVQYPQGGEKQLIEALTGRQVPSGKLPIEVGCVVQNIGTAFAVYEAVQKNKPLIERVVTVTGKRLSNPLNLLVRMGTPVSALLEMAGGIPENTGKLINGGPMMGKAFVHTDIPVVKGMSGVLIMQNEESLRPDVSNCIRCARCVQVCPMGLSPYLLAQYSETGLESEGEHAHVTDCIECGSCAYTCPSARPLLDRIRLVKGQVFKMIRERVTHNK